MSERGLGEPAPAASPSDPREALDLIDRLVEQFVAEPGDDLVVTDPACVYAYRFREMLDYPYVWVGWFRAGANRAAAQEINPGWHCPRAEFLIMKQDIQKVIVRAALAAVFAGEPLAELSCGFGIGSFDEAEEVVTEILSFESPFSFVPGPVIVSYRGEEIGVAYNYDIRVSSENVWGIQALTLEEETDDG